MSQIKLNRIIGVCLTTLLMLGFFFTTSVQAHPLPDTRIIINVPSRTLWLYSGDNLVSTFLVGVGQSRFPTPAGNYKVISKVVDPRWENPFTPPGTPEKNNNVGPLGTRWIGFLEKNGGEYGIHGTYETSSVGKFSSHGCIRLAIADAEQLYDKIDMDTPVSITYDVAFILRTGNAIKLIVYPDKFKSGTPTAAQVRAQVLEQFPNAELDSEMIGDALIVASESPVVIGVVKPGSGDDGVASVNNLFRIRISNDERSKSN